MAPVTKAGRHGTLTLYAVAYQEELPRDAARGLATQTWRVWAYDVEHALERWYDSEDSDGWEPLSVTRVLVSTNTPSNYASHRADVRLK